MSISTSWSWSLRPMNRLMEKTVLVGLVMAWFLATRPTKLSPAFEKPTTEGVVRAPSALAITLGSPPSMMAMQELVVPRSIPNTLFVAMCLSHSYFIIVSCDHV